MQRHHIPSSPRALIPICRQHSKHLTGTAFASAAAPCRGPSHRERSGTELPALTIVSTWSSQLMKPTLAVLDLHELSTASHLPAAFSSGGALDYGTEVILHSQLFVFSLKPSIAFCSSSLTLMLTDAFMIVKLQNFLTKSLRGAYRLFMYPELDTRRNTNKGCSKRQNNKKVHWQALENQVTLAKI